MRSIVLLRGWMHSNVITFCGGAGTAGVEAETVYLRELLSLPEPNLLWDATQCLHDHRYA